MAPKDSGKSSQRRASPTSRGGKKPETRKPEQKKSRQASEPMTTETVAMPSAPAESGKRKRGKAGSGAGAAPPPEQTITSSVPASVPASVPEEAETAEETLLEAPELEAEEEALELEAEPEERDRPIAATVPTSRGERRAAHANALGLFIERQFAKKESPCHSYSDLERHSNISREALSRYVTSRADRRRAPTIDTMVAIADALRISLEGVARAAAASVTGVVPPPEDVQKAREEALGALVAPLSDAQFNAVAELLRQMRPEREK